MITINTPLTKEITTKLKAGDEVFITGTIYTARDAAHKKLIETISEGKPLPFDIKNQIIYYVGPCPEKPGNVIGPAGPTTSVRMDAYTPKLLELGLSGMIGKGQRDNTVIESIIKNKAIYFGATGGAGALIAKTIIKQEIIAYPELGTEAIRKLEVKDFPAIVIIDSFGNNFYNIGTEKYRIK
ncbi:MAG: Fe-S-containing hydro-lyase [archaeon]|jgi:fumarate hydratase subunit beta